MALKYIEKKNFYDISRRWKSRIPLDEHRIYVRYFIWRSSRGLYQATSENDSGYDGAYVGCPGVINNLFGEVHLVRDFIGAGYVVHEIEHLVLDLMIYYHLSPYRHNEKIAYLMGDITRDFWQKFYEKFHLVQNDKENLTRDLIGGPREDVI